MYPSKQIKNCIDSFRTNNFGEHELIITAHFFQYILCVYKKLPSFKINVRKNPTNTLRNIKIVNFSIE